MEPTVLRSVKRSRAVARRAGPLDAPSVMDRQQPARPFIVGKGSCLKFIRPILFYLRQKPDVSPVFFRLVFFVKRRPIINPQAMRGLTGLLVLAATAAGLSVKIPGVYEISEAVDKATTEVPLPYLPPPSFSSSPQKSGFLPK